MMPIGGWEGTPLRKSTCSEWYITMEANRISVSLIFRNQWRHCPSPPPAKSKLPAMLDFPPGEMLCYNRESAIAEKLQDVVYLGNANSRMKGNGMEAFKNFTIR
jgi:hypothetical protein